MHGRLPLLIALTLTFAFALAFGAPTTGGAQPRARYAGLTPAELLERSWGTPSPSERVAMRALMAEQPRETPERLFARAWLASYEGDTEQQRLLLQACVDRAPDFLPCLYTRSSLVDERERIAALERILAVEPGYNDYAALRVLHTLRLKTDRSNAEALLRAWEPRTRDVFIVPFIRGLDAELNAKDYPEAERQYQEALARNPAHFEPWRALADLRLHRMTDGRTPADERLKQLAVVFDFILARQKEPASWKRDQAIAEAWLYLGDQLKATLRDHPAAFEAYARSFEAWPTGEAASRAGEAARQYDQQQRERFLLDANAKLPEHHIILEALGYAFAADPARAEGYYTQAIAAARSPRDATAATRFLGGDVLERHRVDFDGAAKLYRAQIARVKERGDLYYSLFMNRRIAGDFDGAAAVLREQAGSSPEALQHPFYQDRLRELERFEAQAAERAAFYRANPLLERWRQRWGEALRVQVNFASGSSAIAPRDRGPLGELARALAEPDAAGYIFQIEGHTDDQGAAADNRALSQARADAVVRYLHVTHKLPLDRMVAVGFGEDVPRASNASAAGRAANRRVELVPIGAVEQPTIAVTNALVTHNQVAVSPDGRLIATGRTPLQLWDAARGVHLRDLGRGARVAFSPNGRWLAAASSFIEPGGYRSTCLTLYDTRTGLIEATLPEDASEINALSWAPDGRRLVYGASNGLLTVYDLDARRRIAAWLAPGNTMPRAVHWTRDGKHILTGQAQTHTILRWDARTWAKVGELRGVDWPHALSSSADGRYLVATDNTRTLSVWDTHDGDKLRQLRIPALASSIVPHPTRPWVLVNDFGGGAHHNNLLIDLETLQLLAAYDSGSQSITLGFSQDGARVYAPEADAIALLDGNTLAPTGRLSGTATRAHALRSDPRNHYALTADGEGVHVWDVTTGRKVHRWPGPVADLVPLDPPGQFIAVEADSARKQTSLALLDTNTFTRRELFTLPTDVRATRALDGAVALVTAEFLAPHRAATHGAVEVFDLKTGKLLHRATLPLITEHLAYGTASGSYVTGFDVDLARREVLLSTAWVDGFSMPTTWPRYANLYSLDGRKLRTYTADSEVSGARFIGDDVALTVGDGTRVYGRQSAALLKNLPLRSGETQERIKARGATLAWSSTGARIIPDQGAPRARFTRGDDLVGAQAFPDRDLLVWLRRDNTLGFFDLDTLEPRLTLASRRDNTWIAWADDGTFTASLGGTDKVFWALGDLLLPFEAMADRFQQPTLIAQRLDPGRDDARRLKDNTPALTADLFVLPWTLTLASEPQARTDRDVWTLRARVTRARPDLPAPELVFTLQGQDLAEARGFERRALQHDAIDPTTDEFSRDIPLREGLNVVQVSLLHRGARLLTQTTLVTRDVPSAATTTLAPANDLYFLGVGVSAYKNPSLDLAFAHKDAEALALALQAQQGKLYRKVHTQLLLNERVTAQNVQIAMHEFLRQASAQDAVVVFLAGHGVQDNDQTLYFVTHDADPARPYTGMDLAVFHQFLRRRPPNQKAVFWIDICHAGAYSADTTRRGRVTTEDALQQLADGTGLVVLASSTGREFSLESTKFAGGHGAFSAALLEALSGGADKDSNSDGMLTITELMGFVSRRVPQLTDNQQHPTTPHVGDLRDFPIALTAPR